MNELTTTVELDRCLQSAKERPVFIFKHSTRCPISGAAHERVTQYLAIPKRDTPEFFLVKVIESRPVSDAITSRLGVDHQSPQLILVRDGKAVWTASHLAITGEAIDAVRTHLG